MPEMIAFETYRTENITIKGEALTVRFTKRNDRNEYALFATNDAKTINWRGSYSSDMAADFALSTGLQLEEKIYAILRDDIENMGSSGKSYGEMR